MQANRALEHYVYASNNPVNKVDPMGLWPKWLERAANKAVKAFEFGVNVVAELPRAYWDTAKEGRQADSLSGFVKGMTGLPTQAAYGHQDEFARGGVIGKVTQQAVVQTTVAAATGGAGTFTKVLVETAVDTAYGDNPSRASP